MNENEILIRGIVAGMAVVLPFLGLALGKWYSWKGWSEFWQMMHKDSKAQNTRLFNALKNEEAKCQYFKSKLNHIIEMYKPIKKADNGTR